MTTATATADLVVDTDTIKQLREQLHDLPKEEQRLSKRSAQLKAQRDPLAQDVQLLRVRVRAGLAKKGDLDQAIATLERIDNEIRSVEIDLDESATVQRVLTMEIAEQCAKRRAIVGAELTAEGRQRMIAISEELAALQPHVDALLALAPHVAQFEKGINAYGHTSYHRDIGESLVRAVHFFGGKYHGGADLTELRQRWAEIAAK